MPVWWTQPILGIEVSPHTTLLYMGESIVRMEWTKASRWKRLLWRLHLG